MLIGLELFQRLSFDPGTIPATSQLDWPISITAINVASCSRATRDRLKSFSCRGMGHSIVRLIATMVRLPRRSPHSIYDRDVLRDFMHPNETALVAAFLAYNTRYKILFSLSMLHYERRHEMQSVLPEYTPESDWRGMRVGGYDQAKHFPSSLWLRVEG
jgi:hypothetical protein